MSKICSASLNTTSLGMVAVCAHSIIAYTEAYSFTIIALFIDKVEYEKTKATYWLPLFTYLSIVVTAIKARFKCPFCSTLFTVTLNRLYLES